MPERPPKFTVIEGGKKEDKKEGEGDAKISAGLIEMLKVAAGDPDEEFFKYPKYPPSAGPNEKDKDSTEKE